MEIRIEFRIEFQSCLIVTFNLFEYIKIFWLSRLDPRGGLEALCDQNDSSTRFSFIRISFALNVLNQKFW